MHSKTSPGEIPETEHTPDEADHIGQRSHILPDRRLQAVRNMRILLAADTQETLDFLADILNRSGFDNLLLTHDSDEVLKSLRLSHRQGVSDIDVIVLDLGEAAHLVTRTLCNHEEWRDIPAILITEETTVWPGHRHDDLTSNAVDVLFKPVHELELILRLCSVLTLKQERDLRKHREHELEEELAERRIMEARLHYLVGHDDLTGLSNRRHLEQELEEVVSRGRAQGWTSALFYVDLDRFKIINDAEGHAVGDRLLVNVANALRRHVGRMGLVAHTSADEYVVLMENVQHTDVMSTAESLRCLLANFRYNVDDRVYHICASIGVALIQPHENNTRASEFLARADQACYVAKSHGRNQVHLFSQEDEEMLHLRSALYWAPRIREALAHGRFALHFQPVLSYKDDRTTHYEALIRMLSDEGSFIPPAHFIPVAERMGLIHEIDLWVVENAIKMLHSLPLEQENIGFNVNLSGHAFRDLMLLPMVKDQLAYTGVRPERITFEITETAAITNYAQTRNMVGNLRDLGCRFALDDFGCGFSSFNYLKQFPVDYLKIDGGFITNLLHDTVDQTLVRSMIDIARSLGKQTVAEFVENEQIFNLLRDYGADYAQGYYVGEPLPELPPAGIIQTAGSFQ